MRKDYARDNERRNVSRITLVGNMSVALAYARASDTSLVGYFFFKWIAPLNDDAVIKASPVP